MTMAIAIIVVVAALAIILAIMFTPKTGLQTPALEDDPNVQDDIDADTVAELEGAAAALEQRLGQSAVRPPAAELEFAAHEVIKRLLMPNRLTAISWCTRTREAERPHISHRKRLLEWQAKWDAHPDDRFIDVDHPAGGTICRLRFANPQCLRVGLFRGSSEDEHMYPLASPAALADEPFATLLLERVTVLSAEAETLRRKSIREPERILQLLDRNGPLATPAIATPAGSTRLRAMEKCGWVAYAGRAGRAFLWEITPAGRDALAMNSCRMPDWEIAREWV